MVTDPIADYLTRVRNAVMANHRIVEIPTSKMKKEMTKILFEKGYILNYKFEDDKISAISKLERISKPGLRRYVNANELPRVLNGLGVAIMSTNRGVMTDKEARTLQIGGEVLCYIS